MHALTARCKSPYYLSSERVYKDVLLMFSVETIVKVPVSCEAHIFEAVAVKWKDQQFAPGFLINERRYYGTFFVSGYPKEDSIGVREVIRDYAQAIIASNQERGIHLHCLVKSTSSKNRD